MKITAARILETIVHGTFHGMTEASRSLVATATCASKSHPVILGRIEVTGPLSDNICDDGVQTFILISLLYDEIDSLRREVRALRKACTGKKTKEE